MEEIHHVTDTTENFPFTENGTQTQCGTRTSLGEFVSTIQRILRRIIQKIILTSSQGMMSD